LLTRHNRICLWQHGASYFAVLLFRSQSEKEAQ
jgi:hypothetical protein